MGLRDMFSAVSGLQANSTWLDVIGNNIANTNTIAYKASRVEFADQFSQTLFGGTGDNPNSGFGGINPEQIGLGTRVASIQTIFTEGTLQNTGLSTDIAIVGNGFLVSKSGGNTMLTRAGNLSFDSNGNLVDQNGGLIQGLTATVQYAAKGIGFGQGLGATNMQITSAKLGFTTTSAAGASNVQILRDMTEPPNATTVMTLAGNLDSFLQATDAAHGGVLDIGTLAVPNLPLALSAPGGASPFVVAVVAGQTVLEQQFNANQGLLPNPDVSAKGNVPTANENIWTQPAWGGAVNLQGAQGFNYVWDQQPPQQPAQQIVQTVYDSEGTPRQVTINFYQVNDLGNGGINNPNGPNQVAYAWYAFDTTNGKTVTTPNLIGGSGIFEGDLSGFPGGYNRANTAATQADQFAGDLLVFNTDGSLLSTGGVQMAGAGAGEQAMPDIYLPPLNITGPVPTAPPPNNGPNAPASPLPTFGAQITQITLDFGTAGILGQGRRDGVYSDAEGSYQIVNGVNTYVPKSTAYGKAQDGFAMGLLQGVQFDATGTIQGTFTNGQTSAIGQVVMAMPNNQQGLTKIGSNYYQQSSNSGPMFVGFAGQDGVGTIQGNTLELSNVDLTTELSNMIIAQRGFDVNSRVISVENSNLQILSQLGQGG